VDEHRGYVGDVPLRASIPARADRVLLLGHGGGHGKDTDRFVALGRRYASDTGMAVACIDAVDHGERRPAGATEGVPLQWHSEAIPRMIVDWQAIVEHLAGVGPAVAYIGFSMGAVFGIPTVAAIRSIAVAVFVAGGIPAVDWTDDASLTDTLLDAAGRLNQAHVLMLNMTEDALFPVVDVERLAGAVRARSKVLRFWDGSHDDWSPDLIAESVRFVNEHPTP